MATPNVSHTVHDGTVMLLAHVLMYGAKMVTLQCQWDLAVMFTTAWMSNSNFHPSQWLEVLLKSISVYIDNSTHQPNISHLSHLWKSHSTDCKHGSNIPAQDPPSVGCNIRELFQSSWIDPGHCAEAPELLDALSYLGDNHVGRMHPTWFQCSYQDYMPSQLKVNPHNLAYQHHTCVLDLLQTP